MLYIMSASYDKVFNGVKLTLYNDETEAVEEWTDIDFEAYFLTKDKPRLKWKSVKRIEQIDKYDALNDEQLKMWKVMLDNPLAVRNTHKWIEGKAWENHIRFYQCYIYDNDVKMGMPHIRKDGKLVFHADQDAQNRIQKILNRFKNLTKDEREAFEKWTTLIEYPAPNFKRASLDIEVYNKKKNVPSSEFALYPVIAACLASNRREKIALLLAQGNKKLEKIPDGITKVLLFTDEKKLLEKLFELMQEYPFIITFNGDAFDLKYLYNRALRLGILEKDIPIIITKYLCFLRRGFHIDLYKFFAIKAMRIYAFKAKYKNNDLDTVAKALIKKGKIKSDVEWVSGMNLFDLIRYCMNDADITLELTTYNNDLVMNLILMLQRMSRMPIENVSRRNVSGWIRSFMLYEHRQRNILIPNTKDIKEIKGETKSEAVIKGKKYKGAIVFDPVSGTHFFVVVLDFASLYPSIIKVYNIGYSTINCPHEECKKNKVGDLSHWMCTRYKSLESLLIGSLRDLRVDWYKHAGDNLKDKKLKNWYSVAEQSIKVIMNASYGVFGAESFMFYCPPVAEQVTAIARYMINGTAEEAQRLGIEVLYGDTDSIFTKKPSKEMVKKLIAWADQKHGIELEVDKKYRFICLSGRKKNYLGVKENGEVDVKGLTGKKKHTPKIIRDAFEDTKKVLSKIKNEDELEGGKREIVELLKQVYFTLKNRSWTNIKDLAFNITLGSNLSEYTKTTPQHVKAAKLLVEQGLEIGAGSVIEFVKTNKKLAGGLTVKPIQTVKKGEVDIAKYVEFLQSTFEQILDPMSISFEEDILGVTRMDRWMHQ